MPYHAPSIVGRSTDLGRVEDGLQGRRHEGTYPLFGNGRKCSFPSGIAASHPPPPLRPHMGASLTNSPARSTSNNILTTLPHTPPTTSPCWSSSLLLLNTSQPVTKKWWPPTPNLLRKWPASTIEWEKKHPRKAKHPTGMYPSRLPALQEKGISHAQSVLQYG